MKTLLLTTTLFILSFSMTKANDSMLFPMYMEGVAMLRDGSRVNAEFNYNMVTQHMMFLNNEGNPMELVPGNVVSVTIRGRVFIPAGNQGVFKERITINEQTLFVSHRVIPQVGTNSVETSPLIGSGRVSSVRQPGTQNRITASTHGGSNVTFVMPTSVSFHASAFLDNSSVFIHNGNRFIEINSLRTLTRQFNRAQRTQIEGFARENNTNFQDVDDVVAITAYALSL